MRLGILKFREIEAGRMSVEDLTPAQQREYRIWKLNDKLVENRIGEQVVIRLKEVGKFDVNEIGKILENYSENEDDFWDMYRMLDFKWINRQLKKD